ncbi:MAG: hypothetical protein Q8M15_11610 [Bacteroidota bacterium]|nr:hypothetical protein [Bacteroidota bacterium]
MKPKIMIISSGGGHLREAMIALECFNKENLLFVCNSLPHLQNLDNINLVFIKNPHTNVLSYFRNLLQSISIYNKYRPEIILTTGSGIAISMFILGKMMGSKTIYIESGSRINYPSKTGRLLYRFSNHFIIQSALLKPYFPKAILITGL